MSLINAYTFDSNIPLKTFFCCILLKEIGNYNHLFKWLK